jgi:hypothetical protein
LYLAVGGSVIGTPRNYVRTVDVIASEAKQSLMLGIEIASSQRSSQ